MHIFCPKVKGFEPCKRGSDSRDHSLVYHDKGGESFANRTEILWPLQAPRWGINHGSDTTGTTHHTGNNKQQEQQHQQEQELLLLLQTLGKNHHHLGTITVSLLQLAHDVMSRFSAFVAESSNDVWAAAFQRSFPLLSEPSFQMTMMMMMMIMMIMMVVVVMMVVVMVVVMMMICSGRSIFINHPESLSRNWRQVAPQNGLVGGWTTPLMWCENVQQPLTILGKKNVKK